MTEGVEGYLFESWIAEFKGQIVSHSAECSPHVFEAPRFKQPFAFLFHSVQHG